MKEKENEIEKSKRILKEEAEKRQKDCADEYNSIVEALLEKHKCDMVLSTRSFGSQIEYGLHFIAKN